MIRFSHTVFALPFAVLGAFLAGNGGQGGFCGWEKLLLIVLCMIFARSVAMTFNRIADREIDRRNPRTADRSLPQGNISPRQAWGFLGICSGLFLASTGLFWKGIAGWFGFGNVWPFAFSIPVLVFICSYSYAKRFTRYCHFWLGASLMLAPVCAWGAVSPPEGPVSSFAVWILGVAVLAWTAGFDILYSLQDIAVDQKEGLYSIPAKMGIAPSLWISRVCHGVSILLFFWVWELADFGVLYLFAVSAASVLLAWEHWLLRTNPSGWIGILFGTVNGMVSILIAGAGIADILRQ